MALHSRTPVCVQQLFWISSSVTGPAVVTPLPTRRSRNSLLLLLHGSKHQTSFEPDCQ